MLVTHIFDDGGEPSENLLAQRFAVNRRYIFEADVKLIERVCGELLILSEDRAEAQTCASVGER
jgi:hypothetical protein